MEEISLLQNIYLDPCNYMNFFLVNYNFTQSICIYFFISCVKRNLSHVELVVKLY